MPHQIGPCVWPFTEVGWKMGDHYVELCGDNWYCGGLGGRKILLERFSVVISCTYQLWVLNIENFDKRVRWKVWALLIVFFRME